MTLKGQSLYLSINEQVSHQSHGLLQGVSLSRNEGLVLVSQAAGSGHHELGDLVVQAVKGLDRCKGGKTHSALFALSSTAALGEELQGCFLFSGLHLCDLRHTPASTATVQTPPLSSSAE